MFCNTIRPALAGWALGLALLVFGTPELARAEPRAARAASADAKRTASVHFRRGVELYQEGAYRAALIELQRANEIAPDYHVLYNIGQTHYALAEYVEAIRALEAYLAQGGSDIPGTRKEEVESALVELSKRVATLRITADRDDATVSVDGVEVGKTPLSEAVSVSVGRHEVKAEAADGASASDTIDVAGGDQRTLALTLAAPLVAAPVAAALPSIATPAAPPPAEGRWARLSGRERWGYGMLTAGVAVGLGGAVMAGLAKKADSDYADALQARPGSPSQLASARDDLKRDAIVADALFGTALAVGVTGLVLVLLRAPASERRAERSNLKLGFGPRSLVATGRF